MKFVLLLLTFVSLASNAEIGIDVGFKFVCDEKEGLTLTPFVGSPDLAKTDSTIIVERTTKSCELGKYKYDLSLKLHEARGYGAGGGQRTMSIDLSVNGKLIFQYVDFANHSVDSINKIKIKNGKYNPVEFCGQDTLSYSREVDGCISILAQDLILFEKPTNDPISDILNYLPKKQQN